MTPTVANIAGHLTAMARRQPDVPAVICPPGRETRGRPAPARYTFAQLDEISDAVACHLAARGVTPGMNVALLAPPSLDFFAIVFALFKLGAVLVGIDPGIGLQNIKRCLAEAAPGAFIGTRKAHWARRVCGWARETCRICVWTSDPTLRDARSRPNALAGSRPELLATHADHVAAVLFTSGSTGPPKGVVYTHGHFLAQVDLLREVFGIAPGEVDVCTFPLFALFAPALGMTAVIPTMNFVRPARVHPPNIADVVSAYQATNLFGSPALLDTVSRHFAGEPIGGQTGDVAIHAARPFRTLRRVVSAGAPVSPRIIERMTRLLPPGTQVFTPYGATEALPIACIGSDELLSDTRALTETGHGICVGWPAPRTTVRIIAIDDGPIATWSNARELPPGEIGEIVVNGPQVTATYYNRPQETALAKIVDPTATHLPPQQRFWHRMGDVGYVDPRGRLWFCGRKSQRVTTAAGDLFTIPCESVFNTHPQVFRTALVGVGPPGHQRPVLCVEMELQGRHRPAREPLRQELLALAARFPHTRGIRDILFHSGFPVDIRHNAKIGREALAAWATRQLRA